MSTSAFLALLVCLSGLVILASMAEPIADAALSFFSKPSNRRSRK
jgi:hypothetical protein